MGAMVMRLPALLVAKMQQKDRWDLRIAQLAVFYHRHGHSRVPMVRLRPSQQQPWLAASAAVLLPGKPAGPGWKAEG